GIHGERFRLPHLLLAGGPLLLTGRIAGPAQPLGIRPRLRARPANRLDSLRARRGTRTLWPLLSCRAGRDRGCLPGCVLALARRRGTLVVDHCAPCRGPGWPLPGSVDRWHCGVRALAAVCCRRHFELGLAAASAARPGPDAPDRRGPPR